MKWDEYLRVIEQQERDAIRRGGPSPLDMMDAANEDPQGRMPWDAGYETGGTVVELPRRSGAGHDELPRVADARR